MGEKIPPQIRHAMLMRYLWRETREYNSSINVLVVGGPGKGKSWTCIEIGDMIDRSGRPHFRRRYSIKENVAMTDAEFKAMVALQREVGRVNQWEEVGVGAGARNWQSKENIETSQLFQIMRHNRGVNLVNVPNKSMADKHIRSTSHVLIIVRGHNKLYSYGRIYFIDTDHLRSEGERTLYKQLRFTTKSGKYLKFEDFICLPPRKEIREEYEAKANAWKKRYEIWLAEEAKKREQGDDAEATATRRVQDAVSSAKTLIEQGKMKLAGKNRIGRAVIKYKFGLVGREVAEACQLIEHELAAGEIVPESASGGV